MTKSHLLGTFIPASLGRIHTESEHGRMDGGMDGGRLTVLIKYILDMICMMGKAMSLRKLVWI